VLALATIVACREHADRAGPIRVAIDSSNPGADKHTAVAVLGVDRANLRALRVSGWPPRRWNELLRVAVAGQDSIPIQGRYIANDSAIEFHPTYFFDRERPYRVIFVPSKLPNVRYDSVVSSEFTLPSGPNAPSNVVRITPTIDTVPENVLRMYIEFTRPMSREPGTPFVHLIDDQGREVTHAFLPLDGDFWNPAHTRYTVFFDPGRVKRGILPNEQLGRALRAGRMYSIVVDSSWPDANGHALQHAFRRTFLAGPPVLVPIAPTAWTIAAPAARTRDPVVVRFPRPLDHGLLLRALGVETKRGSPVVGAITIEPGEIEWRFTPRDLWSAGDYSLVALSILEDIAGNRIGKPFEVDMFERVDSTAAPTRYTRSFRIK
jgi:hypothetical protein